MKRFFTLGLISVSLLARPGFAREVLHRTCNIKSTTFEGWDAEEISNEWLQLTIVKQLGGRLMQVNFAGHPYLFVNPKYKGKYIPPRKQTVNGSITVGTSFGLCPRDETMRSTGQDRCPMCSMTAPMT